MTFEEACRALGWDEPQNWMEPEDRKILIDTVTDFTDNGTKLLDPRDAYRNRAEIEMFF
ncbi:MAG: hypothetical protein ACYC5Q_13350 [Thermoleophilia bacterium]